MTSWQTGCWRLYNVLVRVLGASALVAGIVFVGWGAIRLLQMGLQPLVGLISTGLGATILGVPTYRPDLGDPVWQFDPLGSKSRKLSTAKRSWWTGDR